MEINTTILLYLGTIIFILCLLIGLALLERYRILRQGKKLENKT
jgi:TM2 domain-containing membrane protein YozV